MNAGHVLDGAELVAFHIPLPNRTRLDCSVKHPGQSDIDPKRGLTRDLQRHVKILLLRSHQGELIRVS